jgi:hypothetical protein
MKMTRKKIRVCQFAKKRTVVGASIHCYIFSNMDRFHFVADVSENQNQLTIECLCTDQLKHGGVKALLYAVISYI